MKEEWIVFALVAMVLFSFSNLMLKLTVNKIEESYDFRKMVLPILLFSVVAVAALFFLFGPQSLASDQTKAIVIIVLLSLVGFVSFMAALHEGSVALVLMITSLSAPFVALLSYLFLGESFEIKQIAAILLAMGAVLMLYL